MYLDNPSDDSDRGLFLFPEVTFEMAPLALRPFSPNASALRVCDLRRVPSRPASSTLAVILACGADGSAMLLPPLCETLCASR